jgi:flagellar motor component MotA
MSYLVLFLIAIAVSIFLIKVKNFDSLLHRIVYIVVCVVVISAVVILVQPDEYIKYNSNSDFKTKNTNKNNQVSQIQYLAIKMKTEGFTEEQIVDSFYHEYNADLSVAAELEKANFSLKTIKMFFKNYKNSRVLENRKLTKEEYLRHLVEQDIKRLSIFSNEDKVKIREMEKNKKSIESIRNIYPKYEPNDEVKAVEFGRTGKSLREIKKVFPNYEPRK